MLEVFELHSDVGPVKRHWSTAKHSDAVVRRFVNDIELQ